MRRDAGIATWLELGPGEVLMGMPADCLPDRAPRCRWPGTGGPCARPPT